MPSKIEAGHDTRAKVIASLYSAINRNDLTACLQHFDPEIVRVEPEGYSNSGAYRGLEEMKERFLQGRQNWAEGACEPEEYLAIGELIVVLAHVRVRLKDHRDWIEGRTGDVFALKGDKIIEMRSFAERQKALAWAEANG